MNVLIVDDDRFVITALEKKIDWSGLSITKVYTAYNIRQAQKIFMENAIEILISDIEMPQGSGLELLSWLRLENYNVQTIFLTNYADFNYAQKAIELQSFEYYLKPIEFDKLTLIIKKAIQKVKTSQETELATKSVVFLKNNKSKLLEQFWLSYVNQKKGYLKEDLQFQLIANNLPYLLEDHFLILIISFFPYNLDKNNEITSKRALNNTFDHTFVNSIQEIFSNAQMSFDALLEYGIEKEHYIAILKLSETTVNEIIPNFSTSCNTLIENIQLLLNCDIRCDIGIPCGFDDFHQVLTNLQAMNEDIINCRNQTFFLDSFFQKEIEYNFPDLELLEQYLESGNQTDFITNCKHYLLHLSRKNCLNQNILRSFRIDITQLIYTYLKKSEILAHKLFQGKTNAFLLEQSSKSLEDFITYLSYLVSSSLHYQIFISQQKSVAQTLCDYIDSNYHDDITRNSLSEIVYLNPDHMARIFKKEKGISLGNYIIQKRVNIAKNLLKTTDMPVNMISDKVGYGNYSYFTKLFKKETDYTPMDYRKMVHNKESKTNIS